MAKQHKRVTRHIAQVVAEKERAERAGDKLATERLEEELDQMEHTLLLWERRNERRGMVSGDAAMYARRVRQ